LQKRGKIILENVGGSVVGSNQTVAAFDTWNNIFTWSIANVKIIHHV
jgi:hypothetical protein